MKKIIKVIKLIFEWKILKRLLNMRYEGYLYQIGWFDSFIKNIPISNKKLPIPWFTYSCIDFIKDRIKNTFTIFEYGSGYSTLYFSKKAKKIISIEYNKEWFEKIKKNKPNNVEIIYKDLKNGKKYITSCNQDKNKYDIIIIDGRKRVLCTKACISALNKNGIIIFDDSHKAKYIEAINFLKSKGFKKIDFTGIAPCIFYKKSTTIFYRANNCLDI